MSTKDTIVVIFFLIAMAITGCAGQTQAAPDSEIAPALNAAEMEDLVFSPANRYIDTLDQLRDMSSGNPFVFRNPQVYEFSSQLNMLNGLQTNQVATANEFITHLDSLRDLAE